MSICACGWELRQPKEIARGYCEHCSPYPVCSCCLGGTGRMHWDEQITVEGDDLSAWLCERCYSAV